MDKCIEVVMILLLLVQSLYNPLSASSPSNMCDTVCDCHIAQGHYGVHCTNTLDDVTMDQLSFPAGTTSLDISHNTLPIFHNNTVAGVLPHLRRLDATYCQIQQIEDGALRFAPNLEELELSHNRLKMVPKLSSQHTSHKLRSLLLGHNNIGVLRDYSFDGLDVTQLDLQHNPLSQIQSNSFINASVQTLSISWCQVQIAADDIFTPLSNSLRNLMWSNNKVPLQLSNHIFSGLHLDQLTLSANGITGTHFMDNNVFIKTLDLSNNPLSKLDVTCCHGFYHVITAIFRNCSISVLLNSKPEVSLPIEHLDLSQNTLYDIDMEFFYSLSKLKTLNLAKNYITSLDNNHFHHFKSLEVLDLTNTPISCDCRINWVKNMAVQSGLVTKGMTCLNHTNDFQHKCFPPSDVSLNLRTAVLNASEYELICIAFGVPAPSMQWQCLSGSTLLFSLEKTSQHSGGNVSHSIIKIAGGVCAQIKCVAHNIEGSGVAFYESGSLEVEPLKQQINTVKVDVKWIALVSSLSLCVIICMVGMSLAFKHQISQRCSNNNGRDLKSRDMDDEDVNSQLQLILEDKT